MWQWRVVFSVLCLLGGLFAGESAANSAQEGWQLVFEHSRSGSVYRGSLQNLLSYVGRGYDVKVVFPYEVGVYADGQSVYQPDPDGLRTVFCDAVFLSYASDSVACVNGNSLAGLGLDDDAGPSLDEAYMALFMASSEGRLHIIRRALADDRVVSETKRRQGFAWYVHNPGGG